MINFLEYFIGLKDQSDIIFFTELTFNKFVLGLIAKSTTYLLSHIQVFAQNKGEVNRSRNHLSDIIPWLSNVWHASQGVTIRQVPYVSGPNRSHVPLTWWTIGLSSFPSLTVNMAQLFGPPLLWPCNYPWFFHLLYSCHFKWNFLLPCNIICCLVVPKFWHFSVD